MRARAEPELTGRPALALDTGVFAVDEDVRSHRLRIDGDFKDLCLGSSRYPNREKKNEPGKSHGHLLGAQRCTALPVLTSLAGRGKRVVMGKSTQDDRQEKAKGMLGEMLLEVIRRGMLGIPAPGVAYVLMVKVELVTQNYVTHFGRMSYEDLKPFVLDLVEELQMRLEQLPGQGVLGIYIEEDFVYSEILEVQTQRNAGAGQARA